ncbi:MAG: glycosyltransferase family 2 protein, partial [Lentisphaeria bacterium]|nr:glycosyltransferase family 2 protein [Lentisphaeria bacterium]
MDGLVSIITPAYNAERFMAETLESVLNQTYPLWELLVIDDGSKDSTPDILKKYAEKDSRIIPIRQENAGSSAARNNGIRQAKGRYIVLLDADDLWEPEFLEKQLKFMKEKNALLVYSSFKRINEQGNEILKPFICRSQVTYKQMLITNHIQCMTGVYDTSKYGKIYLREELKSLRDDYAYWVDIMKNTGIAYGNPEILASYRIFTQSTTGKKSKLIRIQYQFYRK